MSKRLIEHEAQGGLVTTNCCCVDRKLLARWLTAADTVKRQQAAQYGLQFEASYVAVSVLFLHQAPSTGCDLHLGSSMPGSCRDDLYACLVQALQAG